MDEYIKRSDVIWITAETGALETQSRVKDLPAEDVKPVVRGDWVSDVAYYDEEGCPCIVTRCNQCGSVNPATDYCPYCGAVMGTEIGKKQMVHGKWETISYHEIRCSECGFRVDIMKVDNEVLNHFSFCPNCGTDMRNGDG